MNHGLWNGALAGPVPDQALIQGCLQPPAGPLNVSSPLASVHQPLALVELRMGCIHKHVDAISDGAVDGSMEMGLHSDQAPWTFESPDSCSLRASLAITRAGRSGARFAASVDFPLPVGRSRDGPVAVVQATNRL